MLNPRIVFSFVLAVLCYSMPPAEAVSISRPAYDLILHHEVSSRKFYDTVYSHPTVPGAASGVTIGVGYDLGYIDKATFLKEWGPYLSKQDAEDLLECVGLTRGSAKAKLPKVRNIYIPFSVAEDVFQRFSLPRAYKNTVSAFPGVENLPPDAFGALISLVYNRGGDLNGGRRAEMSDIHDCISSGRYAAIPEKIREMKRLWRHKGLDGLLRRREDEASMVENAIMGKSSLDMLSFNRTDSIKVARATPAPRPKTPMELDEIRAQFFYNAGLVANSRNDRILGMDRRNIINVNVKNTADLIWLTEFRYLVIPDELGRKITKEKDGSRVVKVDISELDFDSYPPSEVDKVLKLTQNLLQTNLPSPLTAQLEQTQPIIASQISN